MKERIHSYKHLSEKREHLRANLTAAEAMLWKKLKSGQLAGRKFRRQHSIANYIVDFYCASEGLVVELDGAGHFNIIGALNDEERTRVLSAHGLKVIRFENAVLFKDIDWVLTEIEKAFKTTG